jgi:type IV secretion system protein TrbL
MTLLIEAFCLLTGGMIFLGFGGSRWTQPYVERYLALAVAIGLKIMLFYFLVGVGMMLSTNWLIMAASLNTSKVPAISAMAVMVSSLMFLVIVWQVPKVFGAMLGGAPALTGGDTIGTGTAVVGSVVAAAYLAGKSLTSAMTGGAGSMKSARASTTSSPSSPPSASGGSVPVTVPAPSGGNGTGSSGGSGSAGGGSAATTRRSGRSGRGTGSSLAMGRTARMPSDAAPPPPPPRMPIEGKDD